MLGIFGIVLLLVIGITIIILIFCLYDEDLWIFSKDYWIYKYGIRHPAVREQLNYYDEKLQYLKRKVEENEKVIHQLREELDAHAARLDNIEKELNQLKKDLCLGQQ